MKKILPVLGRRQFLRTTVNGAAIALGLPVLDCFLNENGTAWASGDSLAPCFATWFQGNGLTPGQWEPKSEPGKSGYILHDLLEPLEPFKSKLTVFSGMAAPLGGHPLEAHVSGWQILLQGGITADDGMPSLDTLIGDHIGAQTRFRSVEVNASGTTVSYSRRSASSINASEVSPLVVYTKIFGPGYVDPNKADFKPDPALMVRRSVLSYYADERQGLLKSVGASDRSRLDEYFTALRSLENQLDQSLRKPEPNAACTVMPQLKETPTGTLIDDAQDNHRLFTQLVAHAFACGQTQIANVIFAEASSNLRSRASPQTFHICTHEEADDPKLGYQKNVLWFMQQSMNTFASFLQALDSVPEGPGTLLDRTAVLYCTEHGFARVHSTTNIPVMIAGTAGGRLKSGKHIAVANESVTRVGLTLQRAFGMSVDSWGIEADRATQPFSELLA